MKKLFWLIIVISVIGISCKNSTPKSAKESSDVEPFQIAFYNVENLFDTLNTPKKNDGEYTPESKKQWNSDKYYTKLDRITQVLSSIDSNGNLIGVGLAEIENLNVLEGLVSTGILKERGFKIIHKESPDFRGIDVAFIYNPRYFTPSNSQWLFVDLNDGTKTTRDILRVDGKVKNAEVSIYVNHWPSRYGGQEKSDPKRRAAAKRLRENLDSLQTKAPNQMVLIMGDLNDYPTNGSVLEVLGADSVPTSKLYNATWDIHKQEGHGTHCYRGHWGVLDHIIVSNNMIPLIDTVYAHKREFMCYQNKKGELLPSRSFSGKKYFAGYSDHLPIVLKFK
ncbi:MAG: endonuclease/exonuclease/phosphatase family protein [Salibacteraceae bacterium]